MIYIGNNEFRTAKSQIYLGNAGCDHLPLYRRSEIHARDKVDLHRSTLTDWVGRSTALLEPLADHIGKLVRAGPALFAPSRPRRRPQDEPSRRPHALELDSRISQHQSDRTHTINATSTNVCSFGPFQSARILVNPAIAGERRLKGFVNSKTCGLSY